MYSSSVDFANLEACAPAHGKDCVYLDAQCIVTLQASNHVQIHMAGNVCKSKTFKRSNLAKDILLPSGQCPPALHETQA